MADKRDQEIYKELGQVLYNVSPDVAKDTHLVIYMNSKFVDTTFWSGDALSAETGFRPDKDAHHQMSQLFSELFVNFREFKLVEWNVAHFQLCKNGESFEIDYDFSSELESGELPFWKYCKKYQEKTESSNEKATGMKNTGFMSKLLGYLKRD